MSIQCSLDSGSQDIRALQLAATKTAAAISGQAITGAIDNAIDNFFSGGEAPVVFGPNGLTFNFAADPAQDSASPNKDPLLAMANASMAAKEPPRGPLVQKDWSAWLDLRGTSFDSGNVNSISGDQINVTGGVGRRLSPDFLVGVFTGYENFRYTESAIAGRLNGDGGTIGIYAADRFATNWRVDGKLGWSGISYASTAGDASGSFSGSRWLAAGGLTGTYKYLALVLEPSLHVDVLFESDGAWTDSLGTLQPGRNFSIGRVATGGKVIVPWFIGNTPVSPYVGLYGDYRFSSDNALPVAVSVVGLKDGLSARLTTGATMVVSGGASIGVGGELGGIGGGYQLWTVSARASVPF